MSIAGGLPRAVDRAHASKCDALQIFTKSAGQWRARPLPPEEIALFRQRVAETGIRPVVAHNSYLINVATAQPELRAQSCAALREELDRADALGLDALVMHPGSYTSGNEVDGLRLIAEALARLFDERPATQVMILLPERNAEGVESVWRAATEAMAQRVVDAGDSLASAARDSAARVAARTQFVEFDRLVGVDRIRAFHLNDSKKPCGSRVDRHEHIGRGCLGLEPFRMLLNDPRFADHAMLLETPKLETPESRRRSDVDPYDARNLRTLQKLMARATRGRR